MLDNEPVRDVEHSLTPALDLLSCLLTFDPSERVDVATALTHQYVGPYHDPMDEPSCPEIFTKWEEVESLQTIPELRAAISREISEFRDEVRTIPPDDDEDMGPMPLETIIASPEKAAKLPLRRQSDDRGISPRQTYGFPSPDVSGSPMSQSASLSRTSFDRDPRRGTLSPATPQTALSGVSEESFSTSMPTTARDVGGGSAKHSRRSSTHSITRRTTSSFLFSNPLGSGMTPLNAHVPLPTSSTGVAGMLAGSSHTAGFPLGSSAQGQGLEGQGQEQGVYEATSAGWARPRSRSRAPSSSGEFAIRPLMRQLSTVGLESLARDGSPVSEQGDGSHSHPPVAFAGHEHGTVKGRGHRPDLIPPMRVSPSDAPPSEAPKAFSNPPSDAPTRHASPKVGQEIQSQE